MITPRRSLFLLLLVVALPRQAAAHASLISSSPSAGAVVPAAPSSVRLLFSEPVVADLSHMMLLSADHRQFELAVKSDPREIRALIGWVPTLGEGGYRIEWHIISADGHRVSGTFAFSVGTAAEPPPAVMHAMSHNDGRSSITAAEPIVVGAAMAPPILRGAALSALLAVCGLLGFVAYGKNRSRLQERLAAWLSVASILLLMTHLIVWLVHVSPNNSLDESTMRAALQRQVGFDEILRLILAALSGWALLLTLRWKVAFAFALAAVIAGGTIGHSAAIDPVVAIPSKSLHLVGVAFWFGGVLWLASIETDSAEMLPAAGTVSSIALISIAIVSLSGIVQGFLFLSSWRDLSSTPYGLTLLGKAAGLLILFGFGAYHRSQLIPRMMQSGSDAALKSSLRREIAVMIAVIMLGGFLAYVPVPLHSP